MKASLITKDFTNAIKGISDLFEKSGMVPNNNTLDVLVTAEEDEVTFESANMGMYVKYKVSGSVEESGSLQVNGLHMKKIKLAGKNADLSDKRNTLSISSGKSKVEIRSSADVGRIQKSRPSQPFDTYVDLSMKSVRDGLKFVLFKPHSSEEVLHTRVAVKDSTLSMAANDHFRGAFYEDSNPFSGDLDVILPVPFLKSLTTKMKDSVYLSTNSSFARLSDGHIDVLYPLAEVNVADVKSSIAEAKEFGFNTKIVFDADQGKEAVEFASSVMTADSSDNDGKVDFTFSNFTADCTVAATAGEATSSFDTETEASVTVSLGALYAKEFFDVLPSGSVTLYVWDDKIVLEAFEGRMLNVQPQIN